MHQRLTVISATVASLLLVACQATAPVVPKPPGAAPVQSPSVVTAQGGITSQLTKPIPAAPLRLDANFEDVPLGTTPTDWIDVATEGPVPAWVYPGNWRVVEENGNRVFKHDDVRTQPAVSFQRYKGTALGTDGGRMPERYFAEVAMRPMASPHNYPPTGDQGVQFYYLGTGRYVEIIIKPTVIEIWEADNAEPQTSKGWKRVWGQALQTQAGDTRHIGALVDARAGTFEAYLDGQSLVTVKSALIKPQPAFFALRGIGNVVSFDDVRIEPR